MSCRSAHLRHLFDPSALVLKRFVHTRLCLLPLMANRLCFSLLFVLVSARLHPFSPIRTRSHLIHTYFSLIRACSRSSSPISLVFDSFRCARTYYTRFNASALVLVPSHLYLFVHTHPCRSLLVPAAAAEDITKGYLSRRM